MKSFLQFAEQYLEEKLSKSDPIEKWISDFVSSDNPKFDGKSKDERIKMAQGAYYGAQKEEVNPANKYKTDQKWLKDLKNDPNQRVVRKEKPKLDEADKMKGEDPCWKDYEMVGHKMKNGRKVPNCVPKEEVELDEDADFIQQHLADKDINSSVQGKTVKVHKSNVAAAKRHLAKAGYKDHSVVSGLNEETEEQKKEKEALDLKLSKWKNQQRAAKAMKEESEQIDELDKKTLGNYVKKANDQLTKHKVTTATKFARGDKDALSYSLDDTAVRKTANRTKGVDRAINKLTKEEIEDILQSEEFEQLDELSKDTLTSYVHKAFAQGNDLHYDIAHERDKAEKQKMKDKLSKRNTGIIKATQKIKEGTDMLTYSEFIQKLEESRASEKAAEILAAKRAERLDNYDYSKEKQKSDTNVTKHYAKHSSDENEGEEDEKKKSSDSDVKRGRGRPKGWTGTYKRK